MVSVQEQRNLFCLNCHGSLFAEKLYVNKLELSSSSKLDCSSYIVSVKLPPRKFVPWFIWPCIEYCCHIWAVAPNWYLNMLDKQHKQVWVAPRSTQLFILPRLIKWVPRISGNLVVKNKLPPWSGTSLEAVEPHP